MRKIYIFELLIRFLSGSITQQTIRILKKYFILILLSFLFTLEATCQTWDITFDPPGLNLDILYIDSINNPTCLWEIGAPNKSVFNSSSSAPNSIVTDRINKVPANDTSIFYIKIPWHNTSAIHNLELMFAFELDGDSSDFGRVEITPNNGQNWIDLLTTDSSYQFHNYGAQSLSGSSGGWLGFDVNMYEWASGISSHGQITADTVIFRFIYISGNHTNVYDGWNIDDITINDFPWPPIDRINVYENIHEIHYPNPADSYIYFNRSNLNALSVKIFNSTGKIVYFNSHFKEENICVKDFPNGIYYLQSASDKNTFSEILLIQH